MATERPSNGQVGIARLFKNGRSQAVRLPVDFRLAGDRVHVRRLERGILLEPILETEEWFAELDRLGPEPFLDQGREQPPTPSRDLFD
ncbi:MAG TPA: AbrB/MazE/SpoVT family DNA-binding domain-containing protein [Candidatus Dormibacteraeota bacterium]|nr:AbrB/MazE/SpoVT family DNA-binding domain-containing protein [Candidatus Dormibacteraeota bacterium]